MNFSTLLTAIVAALAILGAAGSAWAFLADRGNKDRLSSLRQDVADRNERIDFLEKANERCDAGLAEHARTITALQTEAATLNRYLAATAGPVKTLTDLVQKHHDFAAHGIGVIETQNADILRILGDRRVVPEESITGEVRNA